MKITKKRKLVNGELKLGEVYKLSDAISFLKKHTSKNLMSQLTFRLYLELMLKNLINKSGEFLSLPKMPEKK